MGTMGMLEGHFFSRALSKRGLMHVRKVSSK